MSSVGDNIAYKYIQKDPIIIRRKYQAAKKMKVEEHGDKGYHFMMPDMPDMPDMPEDTEKQAGEARASHQHSKDSDELREKCLAENEETKF